MYIFFFSLTFQIKLLMQNDSINMLVSSYFVYINICVHTFIILSLADFWCTLKHNKEGSNDVVEVRVSFIFEFCWIESAFDEFLVTEFLFLGFITPCGIDIFVPIICYEKGKKGKKKANQIKLFLLQIFTSNSTNKK